MNKNVKNNTILRILSLACLFYLPVTITINLLCSFSPKGALLKVWANMILFFICFVIALIVNFKSKFEIKHIILKNIGYIYTIISFAVNLVVYIIEDGKLWKISTMLLIFSYSVVVAILLKYLKIKSYLVSTLIYYCVSLSSFMILTVGIAKYTTGNSTMLLFGIFTIVYVIVSIIYYFVKRSFLSFENEEKSYKRQFD